MILRARLTLLATSLLVAPLVSQIGLKHALPEGTILYVGAPNISASIQEMKDMPLIRMWREEEVQDFFADALQLAEVEWNKGLEQGREAHKAGMLPFNPDDVLGLRLNGAGFALTSLDLRMGENEPFPHFGFIAQLDFGDTAAGWRNLIQFGLGMLEQQSRGELTREEIQVGDTTIISLVPPETDMSLNFAFSGSGLVFGTDREEVKTVLGNLASGAKVLSASKGFTETFAQLDGSGAELESYMQPGPVWGFLLKSLRFASENAPNFPKELNVDGVERAIDALGLNSIVAVGGTESYDQHGDGTKSVSKSFVYAPAPTRKGIFASANKELDMKFLRWVPKDTASFGGVTFDLSMIYDGFIGALNAYDEEFAAHLMEQLSAHEKQFGISVRDDLIGSFGHEFIQWSMPVAAIGSMPEMAMLIQVKDEAKLLRTLETIANLSQGMVELDKSERRGITVHTMQINWDPTGGNMGMNPLDMFVPTFSFKDGYMVAGFSTGDVKRVFKRMDREDDPEGDIRSNTEFKPYLESLPKSGLAAVSFSDWKANFEGYYQMVTSMAAFIPVDDEIPIDLSLLPDVGTLTQHLFGSVSWTMADGSGFKMHAQSPWGPETATIVGGGVAAGFGFWMAQGGYRNFR